MLGSISCAGIYFKGKRTGNFCRWWRRLCTGTCFRWRSYRNDSWSCKKSRLWTGKRFHDCHGCSFFRMEDQRKGKIQASESRNSLYLRGINWTLEEAGWKIPDYIDRRCVRWRRLGRLEETDGRTWWQGTACRGWLICNEYQTSVKGYFTGLRQFNPDQIKSDWLCIWNSGSH